MDDIFYTERTDIENEKQIYNIEEQNNINSIANREFNEAYLSKASERHEEEYSKGFKDGENYSVEYGKLLGIIDFINFFDQNNLFFNKLTPEIKSELDKISIELQEFQDKLDNSIIESFNIKLNTILSKIKNK